MTEAKVSILDRGFLFGDGIYEVAAVLDGKLIDNASHLARLQRSVGEITLALPETIDRIQEIQKELIARNNLVNGMVYLEVTPGADTGRDFAFSKGVKPTLIMFTSVKDIVNAPSAKTGIGVITVPDIRWERRDIKSVALLAQVLAKQAAAEAGAGEAWMIEDGKVTEGGSSSAFILTQDDVLVTRHNSSAILPGCTRKAVVALAEERQLRVEERPFTVEEALKAKEAFITSATASVQASAARSRSVYSGDSRHAFRRYRRCSVSPCLRASWVCMLMQNAQPLICDARVFTSSMRDCSRPEACTSASSAVSALM